MALTDPFKEQMYVLFYGLTQPPWVILELEKLEVGHSVTGQKKYEPM